MKSHPRGFEDVWVLDEGAAREVLAQGDQIERVWAVWSLALRATDGAAELAAHTVREPSPGVRRALAVVLAGHGHVDLLVALARHDPDDHVRASAMALVVAQAVAGHVPWSVIVEALERDRSSVRAAILGALGTTTPPAARSMIARCLEDDDQAVRFEAFEALLRVRHTGEAIEAPIGAWLDRAGPNERRLALSRWKRLEDQRALVCTLAGASRPVRHDAVESCDHKGWHDVAPLIDSDPELFESVRWTCRFGLAEVPFSLLMDVALAFGNDHLGSDLVAEIDRRIDTELVDAALLARLGAFADLCQQVLDELEADRRRPDWSDPGYAPYVAVIARARDRARAMAALAHG